MADPNVIEIRELRKRRFFLELIKNTSACCLNWVKVSQNQNQFKSAKDNFEFVLSAIGTGINLDVLKDFKLVSSYNSSENADIQILYDTVVLIQDKQFYIVADEEKNLIETLQWCRCTNTWDEYPEGGVVVGVKSEIYQPQRIFETMMGGIVVRGNADWRQPERFFEIMMGGVIVGGVNESIISGCVCSNSDILAMIDVSGSMGGAIELFGELFALVAEAMTSPTCRVALVVYSDFSDGGDFASGWSVRSPFTTDVGHVVDLVLNLGLSYGGDWPEQQMATFANVASQWTTTLGGRTDPTVNRVIAWAGDAPGHEGGSYSTVPDVISALTNKNIQVVALNSGGIGAGIDDGNQATNITNATDGELINNVLTLDFEDVVKQFCDAIKVN